MTIPKRLRQIIDNSGLSVEKFSERINEKSSRVRDVLNARQRPPVEMLTSVSTIFKKELTW